MIKQIQNATLKTMKLLGIDFTTFSQGIPLGYESLDSVRKSAINNAAYSIPDKNSSIVTKLGAEKFPHDIADKLISLIKKRIAKLEEITIADIKTISGIFENYVQEDMLSEIEDKVIVKKVYDPVTDEMLAELDKLLASGKQEEASLLAMWLFDSPYGKFYDRKDRETPRFVSEIKDRFDTFEFRGRKATASDEKACPPCRGECRTCGIPLLLNAEHAKLLSFLALYGDRIWEKVK